MATNIEIRTYAFLDNLQPQYAAFLGTVAAGFLPLAGDASLYVEVSPGIEINRLTDVALKATNVKPGMQIIERYFGLLEIHSPDQSETRAAGEAILDSLGLTESDRIEPKILSSQIIRRIDDHHAQLINRMRHGQMIVPGETLYVLECEPPDMHHSPPMKPRRPPTSTCSRCEPQGRWARFPRWCGRRHRRRVAGSRGRPRRTRRPRVGPTVPNQSQSTAMKGARNG